MSSRAVTVRVQPQGGQQVAVGHIVFGIPIREEHTAQLVTKVGRLVLVMAAYVIIAQIVTAIVFKTTVLDTLSSICFGLLVPLCGYFGARNHDKTLMGCFCCCTGCNAVVLVYNYIVLMSLAVTGGIDGGRIALSTILYIPAIIIYCVGWYWGRALYVDQGLYHVDAAVVPANLPVGQVVYPQQTASGQVVVAPYATTVTMSGMGGQAPLAAAYGQQPFMTAQYTQQPAAYAAAGGPTSGVPIATGYPVAQYPPPTANAGWGKS